ncbi:MAG: hypothetical protein QXO17_04885 [Nitrososphaerota archaeon]
MCGMIVRIRFQLRDGAQYELETTPEELDALDPDKLRSIHEKVAELSRSIASVAATAHEELVSLEGWVDMSGEVPHMGAPVRRLPLKDQILLTYYVMSLKGKREMKPVEVYEFLRNDGFPANYGSVVARINELAKDGFLIREETGTYRISRFGEDRVREILTSQSSA